MNITSNETLPTVWLAADTPAPHPAPRPAPRHTQADISVISSDATATVVGETKPGFRWLLENTTIDQWKRFGDGVSVDPRLAANIMIAAINAGLEVSVS